MVVLRDRCSAKVVKFTTITITVIIIIGIGVADRRSEAKSLLKCVDARVDVRCVERREAMRDAKSDAAVSGIRLCGPTAFLRLFR